MFVNSPDGHPDGLRLFLLGIRVKRRVWNNQKRIRTRCINCTSLSTRIIRRYTSNGEFWRPVKNAFGLSQDEVLPMQDLISSSINGDIEIARNKALQISFKQREILQK